MYAPHKDADILRNNPVYTSLAVIIAPLCYLTILFSVFLLYVLHISDWTNNLLFQCHFSALTQVFCSHWLDGVNCWMPVQHSPFDSAVALWAESEVPHSCVCVAAAAFCFKLNAT